MNYSIDTIPKDIQSIQNEIIKEFQHFGQNKNLAIEHLIDLGQQLPNLAEHYKITTNTITGCLSQVWLVHELKTNRVYFMGDSNTLITKGLLSLMIRIFSGQKIQDIMEAKLFFIPQAGLHTFIGSQRLSGLSNIYQKLLDLTLKSAHPLK